MSIGETRTIIEGIEKSLTNRDFKFKTEAVFKTDSEFPESKWVRIYITVAPIGVLIENVTPENIELSIKITVSDHTFSIEFSEKDIINTVYDKNLYYKEFHGNIGDSKSNALSELDRRLTYVRLKHMHTEFTNNVMPLADDVKILEKVGVKLIDLKKTYDNCLRVLDNLLKVYE